MRNPNCLADYLVVEDIKLIKQGLASQNIQQKITALSQLIESGQEGLDLVIQALQNQSWLLQHTAFLLLRKKSVRKIPQVKKALREYLILDSQYPDERQEVKNFLSNFSCSVIDESGNKVPNPALLPLMRWGEVIIDDSHARGYRDEEVYTYIVDSHGEQKFWSGFSSIDDGHGIEIDLKFLQKKGYSYYIKDLTYLLDFEYYSWLRFPLFSQQEALIFSINYSREDLDNEENNTTEILQICKTNDYFPESSIGQLIEEAGNWFILSEEAQLQKLPRFKKYYKIPKKYLQLQGYSYYHQISQAHQLPILGYLSPKEYLDFFNLQILDFLSLTPIWSCS